MVTIVIDKSLSNCAMYEHRCLENIKKIYTSSGKCDNKLQFRAILEVSMVSTPNIFIDNSAISPGPSMIVKNCKARKSLPIFTEVLGVKKNCCPPGIHFPMYRKMDHKIEVYKQKRTSFWTDEK